MRECVRSAGYITMLVSIGVLGAFFRGGASNFFLPKVNPVLPKKYPLRGGQILQFCSAKLMYHSFVSNCSASLHIGKKLLNDALKRGKNRREIGKYKAETKQKLLKTGKLGRKNLNNIEYGGKGEC